MKKLSIFCLLSIGACKFNSTDSTSKSSLSSITTQDSIGNANGRFPDIGVIRWDGHQREGTFQAQIKEIYAYSRPTAHARVPFCGSIYGAGSVALSCDSVAIAEQENVYAHSAGIKYWAFLEYPDGTGLEAGLQNYDKSANKKLLAHSLIINQHSYSQAIGPTSVAYVAKTVARLQQDNYQKVLGGRPLVFVYEDICSAEVMSKYCSPWLFNEINAKLTIKPYYVYLGSNGYQKYLGMHAVSLYAAYPSADMSYQEFTKFVRNDVNTKLWSAANKDSIDMVPFASSGWNPQPRFDCGTFCNSGIYGSKAVVSLGSGIEIAKHVRSVGELAQYFSLPRPEAGYKRAFSPANIILVNSWNEQSEAPGLMPTIGPNTSRVDAMKAEFNP